VEFCTYLRVVMAGVAPDVGDPDVALFAQEALMPGIAQPDLLTVDVPEDRPEGFKGFEAVSGGQVPDVAGMPDFIAFPEKGKKAFRKVAVGVRKQADVFHYQSNLRRLHEYAVMEHGYLR